MRWFQGVLAVSLFVAGFAFPPAAISSAPAADHSVFDTLLKRYVRGSSVDYKSWSENAQDWGALRGYIGALEGAQPSQMERSDALAFWINLYNATTLNLILDNYPVKSIKDIGGALSSPWKKELVAVEGKKLTLNQIENDIIRPSFLEPRIHFALNCAAKSCPPLRAGAFAGPDLEGQLEEQTRTFLGEAGTNYVGPKGELHLSKIFEWYGDDFKEAKGSVVDFVAPYFPALAARAPNSKDPAVTFGDYNWKLNEVQTEASE